MFGKKKIKQICGNCKLYNPQKGHCSIIILHKGQKLNLPVLAEDKCFYQEEGYFDPASETAENLVDDIKEVKLWVEDENGQKTDKNGTVKIEYPEGFFDTRIDIEDILLPKNKKDESNEIDF